MTLPHQEVALMRKVYKKPQIEKIKLVLEEAVLQACKQQVPGPVGPEQDFCGGVAGKWIGLCREISS